MENRKTGASGLGLVWFGAAISIAELLTGTALAPLGMTRGIAAILLGHLIGGVLLYAAGLIGAQTGRSAMDTVRISFGHKGAILFAALNVLQLVGWTAIMTRQGAEAAAAAAGNGGIGANITLWTVVIGAFILLWIVLGVTNISKVNAVVIAALFVLTAILTAAVVRESGSLPASEAADAMSFGAAVELSAAMPVSWLPLISDYTRDAKRPVLGSLVSTGVYSLGSCWMFIAGMSAVIYTGSYDIPGIMVAAGFGTAGLLVVVLSTVTTTFLDAFSAGVSTISMLNMAASREVEDARELNNAGLNLGDGNGFESANQSLASVSRPGERVAAVVVTLVGTGLAIFAPVYNFEGFLYLIGSVFAPMIAILIADYFILKRDCTQRVADVRNIILWLAGFVIYRYFMYIDTPVGNTLPVILLVILLCIVFEFIATLAARNK